MAQPDNPFDAFLSYNSKDRPAVLQLAKRLKAHGLKVWLDVEELTPGRPWQEALEDSIESIATAAVLVGKDGIGPWQSREMRSYLNEFVEHGKPVIPVLLDGCPEIPKLPIFLKHFTWVDCRDGRSDDGFWRLVWGITGNKPKQLLDLHDDSHANPINDEAVPPLLKSAPPSAWVPGQDFRDPLQDGGFGPQMVVVPRGTFRMGDIQGIGAADERPIHTVNITQAFAIGRFQVTFDEYDCFAEATGRHKPKDYGWGRGRQPVVDVSWEDAYAYARWLAGQTGKAYRLPSEAEWEYAARAGTETAYWWGDEIGANRANCDGSGSPWSSRQPAPVGQGNRAMWTACRRSIQTGNRR